MGQKRIIWTWAGICFISIGLSWNLASSSLGSEYTTICVGRVFVESIGKDKSDDISIVQLEIWEEGNRVNATWTQVTFRPLHSSKRIMVMPSNFSTQDGGITDLIVRNDHFSFKLSRNVQVIGKRKGIGFSLEGSGMVWDSAQKSAVKFEWRSTDRKIVLPYNEIIP